MRVVAVVQARTGSSRLPGKVLLPLGGRPLLERMLERLAAARELDEVWLATTRLEADEPIRRLAADLGVACVAGHSTDLLDRHVQAARASDADAVVKIPSDCPLIDPAVVDEVVAMFRRHDGGGYDFVTNLLPPTWPDGNDVEVIARDALEAAWREADRPYEREHTTPFIWDQPGRFRITNLAAERWRHRPELPVTHRLTLDYAEDYRVIAAVFEALHTPGAPWPFGVDDVIHYLDAHPEVQALNAGRGGDSWIARHRHELRTQQPALATSGVA
jgi:spore coat polysaccharide biosynthesis protein SpsF